MGRRNGSWNRQFVWPREGRKGKEDVGFFGRLTSIVNNTGPDIFIQKKRSTKPIKVDEWANWASYHYPEARNYEGLQSFRGLWNADRGTKRYDPYTRKYIEWAPEENWYGPRGEYPLVTAREYRKLAGRTHVSQIRMRDWDAYGAKRMRPQYDDFWREAHRAGENLNVGRDPRAAGANPGLHFHENWPGGLAMYNSTEDYDPYQYADYGE